MIRKAGWSSSVVWWYARSPFFVRAGFCWRRMERRRSRAVVLPLGRSRVQCGLRCGRRSAPNYLSDVKILPGGAKGSYMQCGNNQLLSYWAPGNIYAQRGTLSFYWRSREPVDETEFPVFRVGYADHSSWDMVWLRIDYNGHGFDAFVTDVNLGRTRVSYTMPRLSQAGAVDAPGAGVGRDDAAFGFMSTASWPGRRQRRDVRCGAGPVWAALAHHRAARAWRAPTTTIAAGTSTSCASTTACCRTTTLPAWRRMRFRRTFRRLHVRLRLHLLLAG